MMKLRFTWIKFLVFVVGGGLAIGLLNPPGEWYAGLTKPSFNPPNWVFAPVWTLLYVLIAVAGSRTYTFDRGGWAMKFWWAQMILNFLWTPVFFGAHRIDVALAVILLLIGAILGFIVTAWRSDPPSALLFAPYALWVGFAAALNVGFLAVN